VTDAPVLVVDDDQSSRELLSLALELEGFGTVSAANGWEALTYLEAGGPASLILLDLVMPVMDGSTAIRHIRQIDQSIKIVAMSGLMGDHKISEVGKLGNTKFLQKPFTTERLLRTLHESIAQN